MVHKDLGLIFKPPERGTVQDAVAIPLKSGPKNAFFFGEAPTAAGFRTAGIRS
jgi:hypothetical protein